MWEWNGIESEIYDNGVRFLPKVVSGEICPSDAICKQSGLYEAGKSDGGAWVTRSCHAALA